jgi:aspartyl-tRNA(Asn)/glutamyl-tRNA(Gln) amidotransferase subunit C
MNFCCWGIVGGMTDEPKVDVAALAKLARIEMSSEELARMQQELPSIIEFVRVIQGVDVSNAPKEAGLHNVMRADENPHETGLYTERFLEAAPAKEKDRIAVKQVVSRKK